MSRMIALSVSIALVVMALPALAEPPDIEDTDYITGCLKEGKLLSFEISSWGTYRPCWRHGRNAESITLPRANENSQKFTVYVDGGDGEWLRGLAGDVPLQLIKEIGAFAVFVPLGGNCGIAVGPSEQFHDIGFPKGGFWDGFTEEGLREPYFLDTGFGDPGLVGKAWRMGDPDELFYSDDDDQLLIPPILEVKILQDPAGWKSPSNI